MKSKNSESTYPSFKDFPYNAFDNLLEGCQIIDQDYKYLYINDAVVKHARLPKEQLLGHTIMDVFPGIENTAILPTLRQCMKVRTPQQMENEFTFPDGSKGWLELRFQPVPQGVLIFSLDITDYKQTEKELELSREQFAMVLQGADLGTWDWNFQTGEVKFNERWAEMLGYTLDEIEPHVRSWVKLVHPDDMPGVMEILEAHLNGKIQDYETEHRLGHKSGEWIWVLDKGKVLKRDAEGKPLRICGTHLDITERKQAEEALRESETRYRELFENSTDFVYTIDLEGNFTNVNKAAEDLTGYTKNELIGMNYRDYTPEDTHEKIFKAFSGAFDQGKPLKDFPLKVIIKDGTERYLETCVSPLRKGEKIVGFQGNSRDITERKRAEEERYKLQSQLSNALEMAHLGHWEYDVANDLFTFNDHFYKIFRTTAKQVGGYSMSPAEYARLFVHPDDIPVVREEIRKAIQTNDPNFKRQLEHRMRYADGTVGHISVQFFIVKDAKGKTVKTYGVNQDITHRKRMEEELLKVQKLESVGTLAGGIAHDFNNILTTIIGNISIAKMQIKSEDKIFDLLSEAEMASTRAQALTRQLLTFAKGGMPVKETASIKAVIEQSSLFMLRGSKARCEFSIAEDLWPAEVDVGQISQVINNIVLNASQAMPEGGIIQVTAENLTIDAGHILPAEPGRYIRISITDEGVGIAEKHHSKVFDPYFTTKHSGSGLGLAVTYSIIKKHNGHITVESRLGVGTTFHIYLPASEKAVPEKEQVGLIKGQGRILMMDDEASLRKIAGRMLQKLGYVPEFAQDGAEAIEMYMAAMESKKPYDAVILDLTVPGGMGGRRAIEQLLEIDPEIKAVVSSGYSEDAVLAHFQEYGFKGMMPKPFESLSLSKVLHEVLKGEKE
jgi:PAS domain S-box-containing protein